MLDQVQPREFENGLLGNILGYSPVFSLRGRRNRGRGRGARKPRKNEGHWGEGRGERERLPQEPHSIHFCVRWQTQISDWLIFDSKSLEN